MNPKKFVAGILTIIAVAIAGAAVYFTVIKKPEKATEQIPPPPVPVTEAPAPSPTGSLGNSVENTKVYRSEQYNFEFRYPDNFVIGKYKKEDPEPFPNSIVLVEKSLLGNIPATEIPIGEISTITIQPHVGQKAKFYSAFNKPQYRITIGKHEIAKLPGFPGPYGDTAFYYVFVKSEGLVIDFTAHKIKFNAVASGTHTGSPSNYDQVVEKIILTFVFNK